MFRAQLQIALNGSCNMPPSEGKYFYYIHSEKPNFSTDAEKMKKAVELYFQQTGITQQYSIVSSLKSDDGVEYWEFKLKTK